MKELSIVEQRYQAVLAVIADGEPIRAVADGWGVSRQTVHTWLARYEAAGLDGLVDRSHRPRSCPHRMAAAVEAAVLELRRARPWWGPRRLRHELARRHPGLVGEFGLASESAIYRLLVRAGLIEPNARRRRAERFKRWERGQPMELWQLDVVGGFGLADGTSRKALTGLDDHSRFCVSARLMPREQTRAVCAGFAAALGAHGVPAQVLTDNGRVFTGRFHRPPVEVLFDRICRENGIEHLLTQPRSPTTTGKIERFHRSLRAEFDTRRVFASIEAAQAELDQWVAHYNNDRPHQALDMDTPAARFTARFSGTDRAAPAGRADQQESARQLDESALSHQRSGDTWISRRAGGNGVVCVSWQQVCVGKHRAGRRIDVFVGPELLQFYDGDELLKTVTRTSRGEVRKKRATQG
ncbi:MAG: IS481 family transposase [Actinomycetota bacterium]|nr:IS481 family transposase [Actinomycetota bacterium]